MQDFHILTCRPLLCSSVSSALVRNLHFKSAAELSISPSSRPMLYPSFSQGSTPTGSDLVLHHAPVSLMQWNSEVDLARVAELRASENSNVSTVVVSTGCRPARSNALWREQPATRERDEVMSTKRDDATRTDDGSTCVFIEFRVLGSELTPCRPLRNAGCQLQMSTIVADVFYRRHDLVPCIFIERSHPVAIENGFLIENSLNYSRSPKSPTP